MNKTTSYFAFVAISFFASVIGEAQGVRPGFNALETGGKQLVANAPVPLPEGAPGIDDLTPISQPTPDYVGRTTLFDIAAPDLAIVTSLTEGDCTVTFSSPLQARTVPGSWLTWASPPDTETSSPRVLYTQGASSITLTFNEGCAAGTVGFEAEPNPDSPRPMTATYYADAVSLGSITRVVAGASGARLFAADSGTPITRVVFSCPSCDFAIARIRRASPLATLLGSVSDADTSDPIQGALVQAVGEVTRSRSTSPDGLYTMALPAGSYDVSADAFGYFSQTVTGVVVADMTTQNFALTSLQRHRVSGTVTTPDGTPVAGALVEILSTPIPPTRSDAKGNYAFANVPDGTYNMRAGGGRCFVSQTQMVTFADDAVVNFTIPVRSDMFGYTCSEAMPFDWNPGDTLSPLVGYDHTLTIPIGFTFNYYGNDYTNVTMSSNGNIHFGPPNSSHSSVCIPSPGGIQGMVAPAWDLLMFPPGNIYTKLQGDPGSRDLIIEWRDVGYLTVGGMLTMEVILHEGTNGITFQYYRTAGRGDGRFSTVGIQNITGTDGLQYSCQEASLAFGKRIDFIHP